MLNIALCAITAFHVACILSHLVALIDERLNMMFAFVGHQNLVVLFAELLNIKVPSAELLNVIVLSA